MVDSELDALIQLVARAERVLFFTGAGISTASRIPDYRGPEGLYRTRAPTYFQDFVADEGARRDYWRTKYELWPAFRDAEPTRAHRALVAYERAGLVEAVVTQNIDGLHRAAGTSAEKLSELHGTGAEAVCLECPQRESIGESFERFVASGEPPRCVECSGLMKPAVVMFGEMLDPDTLRRAHAAARNADLVVALGSSLTVAPAADVPLAAVRRRVPYVVVNRGPTPHDELATLVLDRDVEEVLPAALENASAERARTLEER